MNIIMSRAIRPSPARRMPPTTLSLAGQQQQQPQKQQHQLHQHQQDYPQSTGSQLNQLHHRQIHDNDLIINNHGAQHNLQHHHYVHAQSRHLSPVAGSRHSTRRGELRLNSPLNFTDSIPFHELKLSSETLGSGSFGTVYKGRWRDLNVAVKQFKTREEINSFSVEVKQLSRVKHPNIVKLYGASSPSKTAAYLIMEYAEGGSLNHLLHGCKQQEYDLRHACSWAMQTARGVAYLHSFKPKPIMHRDLKPANLLLFSRGKILKICDFGTACAVETQMTNNTGSASYMAPEVFSTSSYLESGDVFSWSIIFWEILVRMPPYHKQYSNPYQILWKVNNGTRPREIEGCPEMIWNLITRSWDKHPNERPSMKQVAEEMQIIFSLARTREDSNTIPGPDTSRAESESLPRSPEEVTTPTNNKITIGKTAAQAHNKCRAFVNKLIGSGGQRATKSSPTEEVKDLSQPTSSIAQDEQLDLQQASPNLHDVNASAYSLESRVVSDENVLHHHYHQVHHLEQQSHMRHQDTNQSFFVNSPYQTTKTSKIKAVLRLLELLQKRCDDLQVELESDKRNMLTAISLKEFSELKIDNEHRRQLVRESSSNGGSGSSSQFLPTIDKFEHKQLHILSLKDGYREGQR